MKKSILAITISWMCLFHASAAVVQFDLKDDANIYTALDNQSSATVTNAGIVVTLTASEGVLNRTTSGFGINGPGTDDTDALNQGQYIDLVFEQDVIFSNLNISSWGTSDAGEVQLGSNFTSQGNIQGTGDTPYGFRVDAGTVVRILATADTSPTNGFSVDSFSVETVPEPAVSALISLSVISLLSVRRFFRL